MGNFIFILLNRELCTTLQSKAKDVALTDNDE